MENNKARIIKGIKYFYDVKPSSWNYGYTVQLKTFLDLVKAFVDPNSKYEQIMLTEQKEFESFTEDSTSKNAEKIFGKIQP